jgi:hypothetical protein
MSTLYGAHFKETHGFIDLQQIPMSKRLAEVVFNENSWLCSNFLPLCEAPGWVKHDPKEWRQMIDEKYPTTDPSPNPPLEPTDKEYTILQLNDMHIDFEYSYGSE